MAVSEWLRSSTVATTQVWPPNRNCTSRGGISFSAVSGICLRAGRNVAGVQPRAEDGAGLIALGADELVSDEREHRGRTGRPVAQRAGSGERGAGGAEQIAARVGPGPERRSQDSRGRRS